MSTDLFAEIEAKERSRVAWPFPSQRKREEQKLIASILGQDKPENQCCHDYANCANPCVVPDEPAAPHASRAPARTHLPACNVLALDLATRCGWAYGLRDGKQRGGTELFLPGKSDHNGQRWLLMRQWLGDIAREMGGIQVVYYEDVKRHVSNLSARVYFGYLAILEAWCKTNNVRLVGVGVGTVKKHFTGKGNADKGAMIAEARRRGFNPTDDNHADALAILSYAVKAEA